MDVTPTAMSDLISHLLRRVSISSHFIPRCFTVLFFSPILHTFFPDFSWRIQSHPKPSVSIFFNCATILSFTFSPTVSTFATNWTITSATLPNIQIMQTIV